MSKRDLNKESIEVNITKKRRGNDAKFDSIKTT